VAKLCKLLEVSRSGYYAWEKRPESSRKKENEELLALMKKLHGKHRGVYGSRKMKKALEQEGWKVNHKRVERLMKAGGLRSRLSVKYKATTNSKHNLPVAENLLNRQFTAAKPGEKMVSDITYIRTDEGWLYAAAVLDLYGQKVIGLSMGERMTKELVLKALDEAYMRSGRPKGALIHSDRGSQYCSHEYWKRIEKYGLVCSMSRKGNCWDNAPMEAFWGKMKYEWLEGRRFRTREEARAAVFEYVEIFYNRCRLHASNG
jgi:putative transposase